MIFFWATLLEGVGYGMWKGHHKGYTALIPIPTLLTVVSHEVLSGFFFQWKKKKESIPLFACMRKMVNSETKESNY